MSGKQRTGPVNEIDARQAWRNTMNIVRTSKSVILLGIVLAFVGCDKSEEVKAAAEAEKTEIVAAAAADKATAAEAAKAASAETEKAKEETAAVKEAADKAIEAAKAGKAVAEAAVAEAEAGKEAVASAAETAIADAEAGKAAAEAAIAEAEAGKAAAEAVAADAVQQLEEIKQEEIDRGSILGIMIQNKCLRDGKVKPERLGALQKDILAAFGMTAEQYNAKRAGFKNDPEFRADFNAGKGDCPKVEPGDIQTAKEVSKKKTYKAFLAGNLFGSAGGKLQLKVVGETVRGKVSFNNGTKFNVTGTVKGGKVRLDAKVGKTFFRAVGKADANGNRFVGSWRSFQGDKDRTGSFIASR